MNEKNLTHGRVTSTTSKFSPQIFETYFKLARVSKVSYIRGYNYKNLRLKVSYKWFLKSGDLLHEWREIINTRGQDQGISGWVLVGIKCTGALRIVVGGK